jgi:hypothetical protein
MAEDCRISASVFHHPKYLKLRKRLGDSGCLALICLWAWTSVNRSDGSLAGMSDEDIELAAEWLGKPESLVRTLVEVRFMDGMAGLRSIHDWATHQPFVCTRGERIARARRAAAARWGVAGDDAPSMPVACPEDAPSMLDSQFSNAHHTTPPAPPNPTKSKNKTLPAPPSKTTSEHGSPDSSKKKLSDRKPPLPAWMPLEQWNAFLEMRRNQRATTTDYAERLLLSRLTNLREEGQDAAAVLNQSTVNSWKSLFPVKGTRDGNGHRRSLSEQAAESVAGAARLFEAKADELEHAFSNGIRGGRKASA